MSQMGQRENVHQHSGWLIPFALLFAILLLSGLILGWYLRPGPRTPAPPSGQSTSVVLRVRGTPFAIPANYIANAAARNGGDQQSLALVALFPSFRGYSDAESRLFAGNAPDSPVIHLSLRGNPSDMDAATRLARIYMPYIADPRGAAGPFGLTQYRFRDGSGYEQNDLFAGQGEQGLVLLLCERASAELPSPNCIAIDRPLARDLGFSYRFKRAWLARWREMSSGVNGLIGRFRKG